jgi:hypothetical protein
MSGAPVPIPIGPTASSMMRKELDEVLPRYGFASISEFELFIEKFEKAFELEAANIAKDILGKYAGKLYNESERYQDPQEIASLHQKLGGFRADYAEFEVNAKISNDYARDSQQARLPGNAHLQPKIGPTEASAAYGKAVAAKAAAQGEIKGLAGAHPIFQEEGLPDDKHIDKVALAKADQDALGGVIQSHIAKRQSDVNAARAQIESKPELIYKMDKLMPRFYAQMGIAPDSIYDLIIRDKSKDDAIVKLVTGIALAVVAIALAVVSAGTAAPAIAAGAAAMGFGLSAYQAYEEYKDYTAQKDLAAVGFAGDPSVVWLVIAVVGAGIDMAAAVKAMKALGPAAKALEAGGKLDDFAKTVKTLEQAGELESKVARAAEQAAAARKVFAEASNDLVKALASKAYSFPGPFTDPDVFRALVKMAKEGFKTRFHQIEKFVEEVKLLRTQAKLAEMTPEELTKVKEAWEQAKLLERSTKEPVDIVVKGETIGRFSNGSQMELIPRGNERSLHGGNTIKLDPDATTTVTGTLGDVNTLAERGYHLPGSTLMGENQGGINILRSPEWQAIKNKYRDILKSGDELKYWKTVTDEFWETVNKPWLDEAIARGDSFRFISNPADEFATHVTRNGEFVVDAAGQKTRSIFGREVDYLTSKGYKFLADGIAVKSK